MSGMYHFISGNLFLLHRNSNKRVIIKYIPGKRISKARFCVKISKRMEKKLLIVGGDVIETPYSPNPLLCCYPVAVGLYFIPTIHASCA